MEILLVYPAIGVLLFPWVFYNEVKHLTRRNRYNWLTSLVLVVLFWPWALYLCPSEWRDAKLAKAADREREWEVLEKRVRAEARATHRRQIAEFDKELGIEPEWKKAHPSAAMAWEIAYEDHLRARDLPNYSKGGRV